MFSPCPEHSADDLQAASHEPAKCGLVLYLIIQARLALHSIAYMVRAACVSAVHARMSEYVTLTTALSRLAYHSFPANSYVEQFHGPCYSRRWCCRW